MERRTRTKQGKRMEGNKRNRNGGRKEKIEKIKRRYEEVTRPCDGFHVIVTATRSPCFSVHSSAEKLATPGALIIHRDFAAC
jgi:hypothetical protein